MRLGLDISLLYIISARHAQPIADDPFQMAWQQTLSSRRAYSGSIN